MKEKLTHFIPQTRVTESTRLGLDKIALKHKRDLTEFCRLFYDVIVFKYEAGELTDEQISKLLLQFDSFPFPEKNVNNS